MGTYPCTVGEVSPGTDNPVVLDRIVCDRIESPNGAQITMGQVTLSANWDTDATFIFDTGSNDQRGIIRVTAGTAPSSPASWTLQYNTPFISAPIPIVMREGSTQPSSSSTGTVLTVTQSGAIGSGTVIVYHYLVI